MEKAKNQTGLINVAMTLGTYLGLYQIVKYALIVLSLKSPIFSLLLMAVILGVPFFIYFLIKRYRNRNTEGYFPFAISWMLTLTTIFFATILSVMVCYLYLRYIDHGAFFDSIITQLQNMKEFYSNSGIADSKALISQLDMFLDLFKSMTIMELTKQLLSLSLFWGNIIAIAVALFTAKNKKQ
jgi:hypothetical protein